jgi:hypothetical protein
MPDFSPSPYALEKPLSDAEQKDRQLQSDMLKRFVDLRADIETGARDTLNSDARRKRWRTLALDLDDFMHDFVRPALEEDDQS